MLSPQSATSRDHLALRFQNLPDKIDIARPGTIRRDGDKVYLHLPADESKGIKLCGTRLTQSALSEYLLIFHDDVLYLERLSAIYCNVRPEDGGRTTDPPNVPPNPPVLHDIDPWTAAPASVSPVTQEDDGASEERRSPSRTPASLSRSAKAGKSTVGTTRTTQRGPMVSGSGKLRVRGGITKSRATAAQKTAHKSVATKAVPRPARDSDAESSESSSSSSGEESSSSGGGSSSGNDSADFTDSSSDED